MSEQCQRCGEFDQDRRTLWMACLYEMGELGLPFEQMRVHGVPCARVGNQDSFIGPIAKYADPEGEPRNFNFYRLRVCKNCRADWLDAIRRWFRSPPTVDDDGSGYYVRRLGATRGEKPGGAL